MIISDKGLDLIKSFEGFKSKPYYDGGGVATIGYGTTVYPNGLKVKITDAPINIDTAEDYLYNALRLFENDINNIIKSTLNQNQFDALCSFCYNIGTTAFNSSTLVKKVNANPNDPSIRDEFMKWVYDNKKKIAGLVNRREAEANYYFS